MIPQLSAEVDLFELMFVCRGLRDIARMMMKRNNIIRMLLNAPPGEMKDIIAGMESGCFNFSLFLLFFLICCIRFARMYEGE